MSNGSLEWFVCMSVSFVMMVALIIIMKLSFIYSLALRAMANFLRDHGAGHWYKQNRLAMRLGLKTMLTAVIAVWAVATVVLLICLPWNWKQPGLVGVVISLFVMMLAEYKTSFRVGKLQSVDYEWSKMAYFTDSHERVFTCVVNDKSRADMEKAEAGADALVGKNFAVLHAPFFSGARVIDDRVWNG